MYVGLLLTVKDEIMQCNTSVAKGGCGPNFFPQGIQRFSLEATILWDPLVSLSLCTVGTSNRCIQLFTGLFQYRGCTLYGWVIEAVFTEIRVTRSESGFDNNTALVLIIIVELWCRKAVIITNATTAGDNYKYDSHLRVTTFVFRRGGKNHQGLGCTDQQQSLHKQETTVTSLEDPRHSSLEPQQD